MKVFPLKCNNSSSCRLCLFILCLICGLCELHAQSFDSYKKRIQSEFNQYKAKTEQNFKEYRERINAEFAEYMRQRWPEYKTKPATPVPDSPEPPDPVIKDPDSEPSNDTIPYIDVVPVPEPVEPPQPFTPLPEPVEPVKPSFKIYFFGLECSAPLDNSHRFRLSGIDENSVADGWALLSSDKYLPVVAACLEYRNKLHLCDWAYVRFVENLTNTFLHGNPEEARLMQMFILTQSGYKVRIARADNRLVLMLPTRDVLYDYTFTVVGGEKYYLLDKLKANTAIYVFNREFPKEQRFSLRIPRLPALPMKAIRPKTFKSRYDGISVELGVNGNLIDFFNNYPISSAWDIYSDASISDEVKRQLYPVLRKAIAGKPVTVAANMLLHFVQTAFDYATDDKQFGYERPLFADETFFYPYSDCEDRAILYSILVRELLGLDVVLLLYPGHLATAVCFGDNQVFGDFLELEGKQYYVCDPTYINADIGNAMPQFKKIQASVIKTK